MSENTSNTTTVKPHFKLWAKKVEANEVTPQHPHKPFPGWVYGVLFVIFDIIVVTALEVGVSSSSTRVQLSSPIVGFGFVSKMWTDGNFVFVLNVILVALLYLMLLMLFNRFWTASIVILAVGIIVAAIEHFKVEIRYEAILPADLGFLGSNTGNMLTFIPAGAHVTILVALGAFAVLLALILVLRHFDGRKGRMIRTDNLSLNLTSRLILLLLPILVFALYCIHVSTTDSLANKFSRALGDTPSMWDSVYDAQRNGPLVAFTRQLNPKIMGRPGTGKKHARGVCSCGRGAGRKSALPVFGRKICPWVPGAFSEAFGNKSPLEGFVPGGDGGEARRVLFASRARHLRFLSGWPPHGACGIPVTSSLGGL
jgi:hypothetical protein